MSRFLRPRAIRPTDDCGTFDCGEETLDEWLKNRAKRNELGGASRTFVTVDADSGAVVGYYCISASSLRHEDATGALKRNMPDPIPVILIGRLAVDSSVNGRGVGASLLQEAVLKSIEVSQIIGARAILVHALSAAAVDFYTKFGFALVPNSKTAMYLLISDAEATIRSLAE